MRVIYVGRHGQTNSNDDEGAVVHGLRKLGHTVSIVEEGRTWKLPGMTADFILFNKWAELDVMRAVRAPLVMWYWDLVEWPDPTLDSRCKQRREYIEQTLPMCRAAFLTDGDFINRQEGPLRDRMYWLMQGADERLIEETDAAPAGPEVLFTGISRGGGTDRESFVTEMQRNYGMGFQQVRAGMHGRKLGRHIRSAKVVVAPDSPITDCYWSNRLYLTLGHGGFLLHPYSTGAAEQYPEGVVFYANRPDLHAKIDHYLSNRRAKERREAAHKGREHTLRTHTYRHRCEELVSRLKFLGL